MKYAIRLGVALIVMLVALTSCLINDIDLQWGIVALSGTAGHTLVTYTAANIGNYDLTGIKLHIGLDTNADGLYDYIAWTASFSLSKNQSVAQSMDFIGAPFSATAIAYVLEVAMDKPN